MCWWFGVNVLVVLLNTGGLGECVDGFVEY